MSREVSRILRPPLYLTIFLWPRGGHCKQVSLYVRTYVLAFNHKSCIFPLSAQHPWLHKPKANLRKKYKEASVQFVLLKFCNILNMLPLNSWLCNIRLAI